MSSINTNTSAMVALQTLQSINSGLAKTQAEVSTGLKISNAKDNSAIWAISKVMESDVNGFKAVSDSLALGESTVAVAQTAAETVTDLLGQIKEKVVAAQGQNVDHTKLNDDITALKEQITSVVTSAQFNGLNLVDSGSNTTVLSSIDRSGGSVTPAYITVEAQDLSSGAYAIRAAFDDGGAGTAVSTDQDTMAFTLDKGGDTQAISIEDAGYSVGDEVSITVGDQRASYTLTAADVANTADPNNIVAVNLKQQIDGFGITGLTVEFDPSTTPGELTFTLTGGDQDLTITGQAKNVGSGALGTLDAINVSSGGTAAHLTEIDNLIGVAISAAAAFGSEGAQIATQADFVSKLTDSMKAGMGALVDANMEETSAQLQALQVQQQLGIQALSIANQAPQNILALFR